MVSTTSDISSILTSSSGRTATVLFIRTEPRDGAATFASARGNPGDGLSQSNKIALGIGLGVGLASFIVGLLAWLEMRRKGDRAPLGLGRRIVGNFVLSRLADYVF